MELHGFLCLWKHTGRIIDCSPLERAIKKRYRWCMISCRCESFSVMQIEIREADGYPAPGIEMVQRILPRKKNGLPQKWQKETILPKKDRFLT